MEVPQSSASHRKVTYKKKTSAAATMPLFASEATAGVAQRITSIDALRGLAILCLALTIFLPNATLPAWMYSAHIPPPEHKFDPLSTGMHWVDLILPILLFVLGVAISLSYHRRISARQSRYLIIFHAIERTLLLIFFAIATKALNPNTLSPAPNLPIWIIGLLSFGAMFLIFIEPRPNWRHRPTVTLKAIGWLVVGLLLLALRYPDGSGFSVYRHDPVIILVANAYFWGVLLYLPTIRSWLPRLGIMGLLIACRLANAEAGWIQTLWNWTPVPWLFRFDYLQYLLIVIPGTIIGDLLLQWQTTSRSSTPRQNPQLHSRLFTLAVFTFLPTPILLLSLAGQKYEPLTILAVVLLVLCAALLFKSPTETERWLRRLFLWGTYWLLLGLVLQPLTGESLTLSYLFTTTGLAIMLIVALTILFDIYRPPRWLQLLTASGQNALLAYTAIAFFIIPLLNLLNIHQFLLAMSYKPWLGVIRGLGYTFLLAMLVTFCSQRKIFWRL